MGAEHPVQNLEANMKVPRIVLADDHKMILDALKKLVQPEFEVVGNVSRTSSAERRETGSLCDRRKCCNFCPKGVR